MHPIDIRYATLKDVMLIKNLSWQTFFDTYKEHILKEDMETFLKINFNEEAVKSEVNDRINIFMVAYLKKQPVGYAKLSESKYPPEFADGKAIEISRIYASKEKIGSGVGKALMMECLHVAHQKNKTMIWLGVWEHNQRAIQFYRRFGFQKFDEHIFSIGNERQSDWLMKKELT